MAYEYDPKFVVEFEKSHDLVLVQSSPIEKASRADLAPLNFVEVRGYISLADPDDRSKDDEFLLVGVYPDGSITPYKVWKEGR